MQFGDTVLTRYNLFARNPGKCARLDGLTGMTFVVVRGE
jgi:hypothetical protein